VEAAVRRWIPDTPYALRTIVNLIHRTIALSKPHKKNPAKAGFFDGRRA
jgi:hypothetical protein